MPRRTSPSGAGQGRGASSSSPAAVPAPMPVPLSLSLPSPPAPIPLLLIPPQQSPASIAAAEAAAKRRKYARHACKVCITAKRSCNDERPCARCVRVGKAAECEDSEPSPAQGGQRRQRRNSSGSGSAGSQGGEDDAHEDEAGAGARGALSDLGAGMDMGLGASASAAAMHFLLPFDLRLPHSPVPPEQLPPQLQLQRQRQQERFLQQQLQQQLQLQLQLQLQQQQQQLQRQQQQHMQLHQPPREHLGATSPSAFATVSLRVGIVHGSEEEGDRDGRGLDDEEEDDHDRDGRAPFALDLGPYGRRSGGDGSGDGGRRHGSNEPATAPIRIAPAPVAVLLSAEGGPEGEDLDAVDGQGVGSARWHFDPQAAPSSSSFSASSSSSAAPATVAVAAIFDPVLPPHQHLLPQPSLQWPLPHPGAGMHFSQSTIGPHAQAQAQAQAPSLQAQRKREQQATLQRTASAAALGFASTTLAQLQGQAPNLQPPSVQAPEQAQLQLSYRPSGSGVLGKRRSTDDEGEAGGQGQQPSPHAMVLLRDTESAPHASTPIAGSVPGSATHAHGHGGFGDHSRCASVSTITAVPPQQLLSLEGQQQLFATLQTALQQHQRLLDACSLITAEVADLGRQLAHSEWRRAVSDRELVLAARLAARSTPGGAGAAAAAAALLVSSDNGAATATAGCGQPAGEPTRVAARDFVVAA